MKLYALLLITFCTCVLCSSAQEVPYGNNPAAGHYVNVGDAKIYYEIYGEGDPLVMLHGGVYGYIDEFAPFIPDLTKKFKVIMIATRAHGKSEAGNTPFTYEQRANDAYKVISTITRDSVTVLGFSDGGMTALKLASLYPQVVKRLIAIGVNDNPKGSRTNKFNYNREQLMKEDSAFFTERLKLMPQPQRWSEVLSSLNKLYNDDFMSQETFSKIKCPTLIMTGDRDNYAEVESVTRIYRYIPGSQLSVIPGCSHVVFFCNYPAVRSAIAPFLKINN